MDMIKVKVSEIKGYENNPRFNSKAVKIVADSIREFGFINPIVVDKDGVIIVGHTRFEASKVLGYEEVPVIYAEHLSEEQVKAFRIMDNKSGEFADWDYSKLLEEIEELKESDYDVDLTGFNSDELDEFLNDFIDEDEEEKKEVELEFTEELLEEHQHIVLTFDNTMDWQVAKELFNISTKKALDSKEGYERKGVGRVVNGSKIMSKLKRMEE